MERHNSTNGVSLSASRYVRIFIVIGEPGVRRGLTSCFKVASRSSAATRTYNRVARQPRVVRICRGGTTFTLAVPFHTASGDHDDFQSYHFG
jgi:hypothetical protein